MLETGVLVKAGISLLTGSLHLGVGIFILRRRDLATSALVANRLFATWWIGLAVLYLLSGPYQIATGAGWLDLPMAVAYVNLLLVDICIAVWGLLGFLLYVYNGTNRWLLPLACFYGVFAAGLVWMIAWLEPVGFKADGSMEFARQLGGVSSIAVGLMISVPIFAAAIAYLSLVFRIRERAPRYRIALVGGVFAVRFGWSILASVLGLARRFPDALWLRVINDAMPLLVPLVVILAYRPPSWIRAKLADPTPAFQPAATSSSGR